MRRFACKMAMDRNVEQRLGQQLTAVAERQRGPFLDSHPRPSRGTNWTFHSCCTQSMAHEQDNVDHVDISAAHLSNDTVKTSDGTIGICRIANRGQDSVAHLTNRSHETSNARSMHDTSAHFTNCDYWGRPAMHTKSTLVTSFKSEASDYSRGATPAVHEVSSMIHSDKGTCRALDTPTTSLGVRTETAVNSADVLDHEVDDLIFGTTSAPDYMEECWDKDLEQAIFEASDFCMHKTRSKDFCDVNHEVEAVNEGAAMSEFHAEPSHIDKCKDEFVDDPASKTSNNFLGSVCIQSSVEANEGHKQDSFDSFDMLEAAADCKVSQSSSHLEEGFATQNNYISKENMDEFSDDDSSSENPLKFSKQQIEVLEAVACGKSVFITGSAGTGKSFLLMYIIRVLKNALPENSVYVTASTGIAACALKGITIHAFAGIGLGSGTESSLARRVLRQKVCLKRWKEAAVLIIDEISMIDGDLFDKLEFVARRARNSTKCFGGIQLIVTGDFFQLPPVNPPNLQKFFAFEAECWNWCFHMQVELEHVFRQSDRDFVKMLNEIRKGIHTSETLQKLNLCYRALPDDGTGIVPTQLYPLKTDVRQENMQELRALQTSIVTFFAVDSQTNPLHRYAWAGSRCEKELQLCVGAQVMLTKNLDTKNGLVNGAKGVVTGFQSQYTLFSECSKDEKAVKVVAHLVSPAGYWPIVRFDCGTKTVGPNRYIVEDGGVEVSSRIQVPLILAWALSIHKCQGMTLSKVQTDLSKAFQFGMVYVALSRVKDLDGLQLLGYDPTRIKAHPKVVAFSNKMSEGSAA